MSGPKYSQFEIEQRRQRELERERQRKLEEEKRKQELAAKIQKAQASLQAMKNEMKKKLKRQLQLMNQEHAYLMAELEEEMEKLLAKDMSYSMKVSPTTTMNEMQHYLKDVQRIQSEIQNEANKLFHTSKEKWQEVMEKEADWEQKQSFFERSGSIEVKQKQSFDLPSFQQAEAKEEKVDLADIQESALEALQPYIQEEFHLSELQQLYDSIIEISNHDRFDSTYKKTQIERRLKAFYASKKRYDQQIERFQQERSQYETLLVHYQSLCQLTMTEADPSFLQPSLQNILQLSSQIREEIAQLEAQYVEKQETEYIVQSVNEVMESLGYDIIATDYMIRKTQNVHHHLYEFGFDQAVNVFVSDNGSVLFEVSGISEGTTEMTSLEKLKVKEAMDAFCTDYEDIKAGLKAKGILLTNENLNPADEKYARTIDISNKNVVRRTAKGSHSKVSAKKLRVNENHH